MEFRNEQSTGLVIDASGSGNSVTVRLWGTPEYDVSVSTSPRSDVRRPQTRVVTTEGCTPESGADGYTVRVTRTVLVGDSTVSTDTFTSTYAPRDRIECRAASSGPSAPSDPGGGGESEPDDPEPAPGPGGPIGIPGLPEIQLPEIPGLGGN